MKSEIKEGLLELGRVIVISIIPVLLMGINQTDGTISIDWKLVLAVGLIALIRAVDKYLHKFGQSLDNETISKGLTRF